jgi:hypothetical protein
MIPARLVAAAGLLLACAAPAPKTETPQPSSPPPAAAPGAPDAPASLGQLQAQAMAGLPEPPAGFTWVRYRNAAIAKPVGWHERSAPESDHGSQVRLGAWAMSPEEFSETKQFQTGYTVQVTPHPRARHGVEPSDAALLYLKPYIDAHKEPQQVLLFDRKQKGTIEMIVFRYRDAPPSKTAIIVHKLLIVNPQADSVHAFTFECPEATWQENWEKYGTPILSRVAVFPNLPSEE